METSCFLYRWAGYSSKCTLCSSFNKLLAVTLNKKFPFSTWGENRRFCFMKQKMKVVFFENNHFSFFSESFHTIAKAALCRCSCEVSYFLFFSHVKTKLKRHQKSIFVDELVSCLLCWLKVWFFLQPRSTWKSFVLQNVFNKQLQKLQRSMENDNSNIYCNFWLNKLSFSLCWRNCKNLKRQINSRRQRRPTKYIISKMVES